MNIRRHDVLSYGVVSIPLDECVQEWELGVLFSFHGKLCLGVKAAEKVMLVGFSYNRKDVINIAFLNFWWMAGCC